MEPTAGENSVNHNIHAALDDLMSIDLPGLENASQSNSGVFERIHASANTVLAFLDAYKDTKTSGNAQEFPSSQPLALLLRVPVLNRLFAFRRIFHTLASDSECADDTVAVVCWVDHILAKLGDATLVLLRTASGSVSHEDTLSFHTLVKHRQESTLYAAAQLPHSWFDVVNVVGSEYASPAAVRLALCLLYAAYIVGPDLGNESQWCDGGPQPAAFMRPLQTYIHRNQDVVISDRRIPDAMAVAVFAAADSAQKQRDLSPFRPHTQAALLEVIQNTLPRPLDKHSLLMPMAHTETHLTTLCAWGHTVEWCWSCWDDERIADYDVILQLTSTWLYQLDISIRHVAQSEEWEQRLLAAVARNPRAAAIVFNALLRRGKACAEVPPPGMLDVLLRSCRVASWLLSCSDDAGDVLYRSLCGSMCGLFILLPDHSAESRVKDVLVEAMSYVVPDVLGGVIQRLCEQEGLSVKTRLDDRLRESSRKSAGRAWSAEDCHAATILLQFATLVGNTNIPLTTCFYPRTILAFIKQVIEQVALFDGLSEDGPWVSLLQAVLTALAVLEKRDKTDGDDRIVDRKLWADEDVWALALDFERHDLLTISTFASYLVVTTHGSSCDAVWHATAWDFLRDTLLEIIHMQEGVSDDTLRTYACAMMIAGMHALLENARGNSAEYIRSSPWTSSLSDEMQKLASTEPKRCGLGMVAALANMLHSKIAGLLHRAPKRGQSDAVFKEASRRDESEIFCFVVERRPNLCLVNVL